MQIKIWILRGLKVTTYHKFFCETGPWTFKSECKNTKELMHCHCGTNNRAPQWTFMDPCKPVVRPGAREESASPAWLAAPAMNACDKTKVYIQGSKLTLVRWPMASGFAVGPVKSAIHWPGLPVKFWNPTSEITWFSANLSFRMNQCQHFNWMHWY